MSKTDQSVSDDLVYSSEIYCFEVKQCKLNHLYSLSSEIEGQLGSVQHCISWQQTAAGKLEENQDAMKFAF